MTDHAAVRVDTPEMMDSYWTYAGLAGVFAGLLRPGIVTAMELLGTPLGTISPLLPTDVALWWIVHLAYGFAFGAAFAAIVWREPLREYAASPVSGAALGIGYGLALWAVNVAIVWNLLLAPLIYVTTPPSAFQLGPIVGHLGYGVVVGALYPFARRLAA